MLESLEAIFCHAGEASVASSCLYRQHLSAHHYHAT